MATKLPKAFYSEIEAARALGVTPNDFRALLRQHLGTPETDLGNSPQTTYHASDVLLLKMFVAGRLDVPAPSVALPEPPAAPTGDTAAAELPSDGLALATEPLVPQTTL